MKKKPTPINNLVSKFNFNKAKVFKSKKDYHRKKFKKYDENLGLDRPLILC